MCILYRFSLYKLSNITRHTSFIIVSFIFVLFCSDIQCKIIWNSCMLYIVSWFFNDMFISGGGENGELVWTNACKKKRTHLKRDRLCLFKIKHNSIYVTHQSLMCLLSGLWANGTIQKVVCLARSSRNSKSVHATSTRRGGVINCLSSHCNSKTQILICYCPWIWWLIWVLHVHTT